MEVRAKANALEDNFESEILSNVAQGRSKKISQIWPYQV